MLEVVGDGDAQDHWQEKTKEVVEVDASEDVDVESERQAAFAGNGEVQLQVHEHLWPRARRRALTKKLGQRFGGGELEMTLNRCAHCQTP